METKNNKLIVVLGMHRSGTSAIARGLQVMGASLGERLMPPNEAVNAKGFWEDIDLNALNIEMLQAIDSDWFQLAPIEASHVDTLCSKGYLLRAVELLREKRNGAQIFAFKDPRVAKLIPFWKEVFSRSQLNVSYVLTTRHPLSVVKSLAKHHGLESAQSYLLWLGHVMASLTGSEGNKRVLVDYDRLMHSPDEELMRISKGLGLEIDTAELQSYKTQFLDQELRHTVCILNDLDLDNACPPIVREVYASLLDVASDQISLDDKVLQNKVAVWADEFERLKSPFRLVDRLYTQKAAAMRAVAERDAQFVGLSQAVHDKDVHIANLDQAISERDAPVLAFKESVSRRLARPLRMVKSYFTNHGGNRNVQETKPMHFDAAWYLKQNPDVALSGVDPWDHYLSLGKSEGRQPVPDAFFLRNFKRARLLHYALLAAVKNSGSARRATSKAWAVFKREGWNGIRRRVIALNSQVPHSAESDRNDYAEWIRRYDTLTEEMRATMRARIEAFSHRPLISVVMPVYNPPLNMLEDAIRSVQAQLYQNWELCIADDASTDSGVRKLLQRYADNDVRIKVVFRKENGHISAASNSALDLVCGEYVALLDNDDLLREQALYWVADAIVTNPDAGIVYSDEDKIDWEGQRYDPYFKPDWNPDLFLSHNMICHLGAYRTDLVRKLGGFREGYEGAQDYDLALRCTEQLASGQIVHIPRVLYHWRSHPGSTAQAGSEKNYALLAGERVLNDHFSRIHVSAKAELLDFGMYRVRYDIPAPAPLVSLIIPTRNGLDLIKQCIESIFAKTSYKNYEILIVDNNSDDPNALEYFDSLAGDDRIRVIRDERPFNYSALNNAAVDQARGEYIGLINNDIEVISPMWLGEMMSLASQPGVGAVGARLWYPNDTLQHGGVIIGLGGVAGHSHKHLHKSAPGYFRRAELIQTLSAVTAACLVVKKSIFQELGGLDEDNLKVAFNDVDFCLRVREAGYRNVWTPYAELYHHESATRGHEDTPEKKIRFGDEVQYMKKRWGSSLLVDAAYSPNLTLDLEDFSYAWPPRINPTTK